MEANRQRQLSTKARELVVEMVETLFEGYATDEVIEIMSCVKVEAQQVEDEIRESLS